MNTSNIEEHSDILVRKAKALFPDAELHELGALFLSIGCFLTANAIPDLWKKELKPIAILSHQLLHQDDIPKVEKEAREPVL